jgi:hypothetical protein
MHLVIGDHNWTMEGKIRLAELLLTMPHDYSLVRSTDDSWYIESVCGYNGTYCSRDNRCGTPLAALELFIFERPDLWKKQFARK